MDRPDIGVESASARKNVNEFVAADTYINGRHVQRMGGGRVCEDALIRSRLPESLSQGDPTGIQRHDVQNLWQRYRSFVRNRYDTLQLWDEAVTRLLFWAPHSGEGSTSPGSRLREVLYGLLSLHRMAMDMAYQETAYQNSYGTTLKVDDNRSIQAEAIRVALTVIHGLMPTMLELARTNLTNSHKFQSTVRLHVERIKLGLRIFLLASYWKKVFKAYRKETGTDNGEDVALAGILRSGGMYLPKDDSLIPSTQEERDQWRRRQYVGRRTGRRVRPGGEAKGFAKQQRALICLAEFLHILRPFFWAHAENKHAHSRQPRLRSLWLSWMVALGIDLGSIRCLSTVLSDGDSPLTRDELRRRRIRVLLCLLRAPAWNHLSRPTVHWLLSYIERVPVLGRLVETFLWDLLIYWKHPFFLEEA